MHAENQYLEDGLRLLDHAYETHRQAKATGARLALFDRDRCSAALEWSLALGDTGTVEFMLAKLPGRIPVIMLVIPGTNEPADWRLNLDVRRRMLAGFPGSFRAGFLAGAERLWYEADILALQRWGLKIHSGGVRLVIIGHSLGGGIAGAYGALLHSRAPMAVQSCWGLLTVSAPRFCSPAAARKLGELYGPAVGQRWRLGLDVVPGLVLPLAWSHALDPHAVGSDGVERPRVRFWRELWHALRTQGLQFVRHHLMTAWTAWLDRRSGGR
jgi:pimeloyl-ACP methyl ester carboxylesterase